MCVLKIFTGAQNARKFIQSLGEMCVYVFSYIQVVMLEEHPH